MSYLTTLGIKEGLESTTEVIDYIIDSYVVHDSLNNFVRHTNRLDKEARALIGQQLIEGRKYINTEKLKFMIIVLIDHPTKVE